MNRIGMSSSCFYPMELEESFLNLAKSGLKTAEIFINAESEFRPEFVNRLIKIRDEYAIDVVSIHPYTSFMENTMLFSSYKRRFYDFLETLDRHFNAAAMLGAKYYIIHGIRENGSIDDREYFERFAKVIERGKAQGVLPIQENVVHHRSQSPEFMAKMRDYIGDDFKMTLDTKQARRAGVVPFDFIDRLAKDIAHVHISDCSNAADCIVPLTGSFDFTRLFETLLKNAYKGDFMIELYSNGYSCVDELTQAAAALKKLLDFSSIS